jgi:hypothetical protein
MTRKDMQRIFDNLSKEDILLVGRMYQKFVDNQRKSTDDGTSVAKDAVLAVLPKVSDRVIYAKWVPAMKVIGLEHDPLNGSFRAFN